MKRLKLSCLVLAAAAATFAPKAASAATITDSDTISLTPTGWSLNMHLSKFDPSLGALNSISIALDGNVFGTAMFESLDGDSSVVETDLGATIKLKLPNPPGGTLVVVTPTYTNTETVAAFDGNQNYDGPSG